MLSEYYAIRFARKVADLDKGDPFDGEFITLTPKELIRFAHEVINYSAPPKVPALLQSKD